MEAGVKFKLFKKSDFLQYCHKASLIENQQSNEKAKYFLRKKKTKLALHVLQKLCSSDQMWVINHIKSKYLKMKYRNRKDKWILIIYGKSEQNIFY